MESKLTLALDFLKQKLNHAFSKSCFVGILGTNQNEERDKKGTKYHKKDEVLNVRIWDLLIDMTRENNLY